MSEVTCQADNCGQVVYAKSLCRLHYQRNRKPPKTQIRRARQPKSKVRCQVDDCEQFVYAKALCRLHWQRSRYKPKPRTKRPALERFESKVDRSDINGCHVWTGGHSNFGHGLIHLDGKRRIGAHVFAYLHFVGPIPEGLFVCHRCDNPPCVRPDHLFVGTAADNNRDRANKGRSNPAVGERSGHAKLTWDGVAAIRERYAHGGIRYKDLAAQYGVDEGTIKSVIQAKSWRGKDTVDLSLGTPNGERSGTSKLTWESVAEIRRLYASGEANQEQLAQRYDVIQATISQIVRGNRWRTGEGDTVKSPRGKTRKVSDDEVVEIRCLYDEKLFNQKELAKKFGVSPTLISQIIRRARRVTN